MWEVQVILKHFDHQAIQYILQTAREIKAVLSSDIMIIS